jgi:hypothetical protein
VICSIIAAIGAMGAISLIFVMPGIHFVALMRQMGNLVRSMGCAIPAIY